MKQVAVLLILIGASMVAFMAQAANVENGKAIHASKCMACHDNGIYTRPDSIIHSYSSLQNRVKFCDVAADANLSEAQINDVIAYLNRNFYKFEE